ncbi:MAG: type 4a pilus biogenesis protein PilO [Armatimonadetes bacterium]|nr:type 4a pilus biogenesis protein PilO [Armatimonadota bacterium]
MWNRLSNREKILLSIIAFAYAACHFLLGPQIKAYQDKAARLKEARAMLGSLDAQAEALKMETVALEQARARLKKLLDKFSTQMQDGLFLVQFGRLAEKNGVQIRKFKPAEVVDSGYILTLPVEVELRGTYPSIILIIDYLENLANLTEIRNLRFQAEKTQIVATGQSIQEPKETTASSVYAPAAVSPGTVTVSMTLLIYTQPTPEGRIQLEGIKNWVAGRPDPFKINSG